MWFKSLPGTMALLFLVGISFGSGWWLRGLDAGTVNDVTDDQTWGLLQAYERGIKDSQQSSMRQPNRAPAAVPPAQQQARASSVANLNTDHQTFAEEFRALLDRQDFSAAMDIYASVERRSQSDATQLKNTVMSYLETYLNSNDDTALTNLVDAFLGRYYDDVDVLLILARYHWQSDYPAEAARTFQLANTYAFSPAKQQQVSRALQSFVQDVDSLLAGQARWQDLILFYETLTVLDLSQPAYQLRQAELYLARGETASGRSLLSRLANNPAVARQAETLLRNIDAGSAPDARPKPRKSNMDSIALDTAGSHYHLPMRINGAVDIRLVIDTGATTTTITQRKFESMSRRSNFTFVGPQMFNTANGVTKGTVYRADKFQLGNHVLSDINIAVLDFDMPDGIDGLLGMNVLSNFRFEVDQDESLLYLQPR